jgi:hypothetical protein
MSAVVNNGQGGTTSLDYDLSQPGTYQLTSIANSTVLSSQGGGIYLNSNANIALEGAGNNITASGAYTISINGGSVISPNFIYGNSGNLIIVNGDASLNGNNNNVQIQTGSIVNNYGIGNSASILGGEGSVSLNGVTTATATSDYLIENYTSVVNPDAPAP